MRVLRVYHGGRSRGHRARERALAALGIDLTLIVPKFWGDGGDEETLSEEPFRCVELPVVRPGDVNRHRYADPRALRSVIQSARPDVVDIHAEPFSAVTRQVLSELPDGIPVVLYAAQNLDKRYPPPFNAWERAAYQRASAIYPCSRQAASVVRGRGFHRHIEVIPLGYDPAVFYPGRQAHSDAIFQVALVGRLVPEKGIRDAVAAFSAVRSVRLSRLVIGGEGPEGVAAPRYLAEFGVRKEDVDRRTWLSPEGVADVYRDSHIVLVPSLATTRIVEQFGRMVPEAQASGAVVAGYATGALPHVARGAAWLGAPGDVAGLSTAVADVAAEQTIWRHYRNAGICGAVSMAWDAVAAAQETLYRRVATQGTSIATTGPVGRSAAVREFGPSAMTTTNLLRPLSLPGLRSIRRWPSVHPHALPTPVRRRH